MKRRSGERRPRTVRTTAALGVASVLLVVGCGWTFLLGSATADLGSSRADLAEVQDANLLLSTRLTRLEAQRADLSSVVEVADELAVLFPPTADQPGFFRMVDRATRAAGLRPRQVTTLSPTVPIVTASDPAAAASEAATAPETDDDDGVEASQPTPDLAVQSVVVTVEGTYEQAQRLLGELEHLDRSFLVRSVTVSGEDELTIAITGSTFVAPLVLLPDSVE